jgi:hypothetical protein
MLNSHPRIYIPPESDFIPRFFLNNHEISLSRDQISRYTETIYTEYRFVREWEGPRFNISAGNDVKLSPAQFLDNLYSIYAQQKGAERWGDKTPIYSSYVDLINNIFPSAQFIHLIRDGRDVALSMLDKWGKREIHIDIYFAARNWDRRIREARSSGKQLGFKRYYEVYYEKLVTNPEDELINLCEYLQEEYKESMVNPHELGQKEIEPGSFHTEIRNPPSPKRIARWEKEMSLEDQRLFHDVAGELLNQLNYPILNLGKMSFSEKLRFNTLKAKYEILQSGRGLLTKLGIMPPI